MTDALAALREGSRETWTSPLTGVTYTYRRLTKADLVECPEALPIFDLAISMALEQEVGDPDDEDDPLTREVAKRRLAKLEDERGKLIAAQDKVDRFLITKAVVSPPVLDDPDDMADDPPDGSLFYYQVPEVDRQHLLNRIQTLAAGLDALERRLTAHRAAQFREVDNGETDPSVEQTGDTPVRAVGDN